MAVQINAASSAEPSTALLLDRMLRAPPLVSNGQQAQSHHQLQMQPQSQQQQQQLPPHHHQHPHLHAAQQPHSRWLSASSIQHPSLGRPHQLPHQQHHHHPEAVDHRVSTPEPASNSSSSGRATTAAAPSAASAPLSACDLERQQQEWSRRLSAGLCPHCDAPAATEEQRHFHERVHAMDELYRCQLCACRFAYPSSLRLHLALHTDRTTGFHPRPQHQPQQQLQQHYPEQQQLQQQQPQQQQQHDLLYSHNPLAYSNDSSNPFHQQHLQQQQQQQQQPPQQQQQQQSQHQHQSASAGGKLSSPAGQHACPQCGRCYIRAGNLRNHMLRFHPY